ncbi:ribokinase [Amycolatopsis sp. K13G38]|uniref:Ribokinase n=1 Tax=Amycolatopsis acididurans TaxID=2724524 RepID=A0ABX1JCH6_9PSEU|nr:PfkB family carbohydrate kinase [Amycolatopsis acididurans]NKQ57419.1 ribokinase [Amycolatopsis acididurans]
MTVVVVGQIARDLVLRTGEFPGAGTSAPVRSRREILGGKGANQAVGLAQLGVPVSLVGVIGDDHTGEQLLAHAKADHVDVSQVVRRTGAETALIVDVVDDHGQWRYLEHVPSDLLVTERDVFAASEQIYAAEAVVVQLQQPPVATLEAARLARAADAKVVLDGAPEPDVLAYADVLRADAREAELLAGRAIPDVQSAVEVGNSLLEYGLSLVVLEVSGQGNVFVTRAGYEFLPLAEVEVVDTTGAGDALVATLTYGLVAGKPVPEAARLAVAAAAQTGRHAGGRPRLSLDLLNA